MTWRVELGDCIEVLAAMPDASIDAVVTDPPYGLEFMGKEWDRLAGTPGYSERGRITDRDAAVSAYVGAGGRGVNSYQAGRPMQEWHEAWAREALRVLKPGGYLLAFGGTRTFHRLTCAIEDAGFEVRDVLSWLYGSGFPKSRNLTGEHDGWGTALKPAWEPVVMARRPLAGTVAANVLAHGTGALNVDGCRIEGTKGWPDSKQYNPGFLAGGSKATAEMQDNSANPSKDIGRWPANVVLDPEAAAMLDEQSGERAPGAHPAVRNGREAAKVYGSGWSGTTEGERRSTGAGGASRFFYCAKAGAAERSAGLDGRNVHPTVKPIELMRWLVRLVTPVGGTVLDPFTGSGTTGCAAVLEGFDFVGVERDPEYVSIAQARIAHWRPQGVQLGLDEGAAA